MKRFGIAMLALLVTLSAMLGVHAETADAVVSEPIDALVQEQEVLLFGEEPADAEESEEPVQNLNPKAPDYIDSVLAEPVPGAMLSNNSGALSSGMAQSGGEFTLTLGVKETYTFSLIVPVESCTFKSSNTKVATVSSVGKVTAKKTGTAVVTISSAYAVDTITVTVKKAPDKITLASKTMTLGVGESKSLGVTLPKNTYSNSYNWTSSNGSVAVVDNYCNVVAKGVGTATITIKTFNGKSAKCTVTVKAAPTYISVPSSYVMSVDETYTLPVTLGGNGGGTVTYASSNTTVATVSAAGKITAKAKGFVTITATTYNGYRGSCSIEVKGKPAYRALLVSECSFAGADYRPMYAKSVKLLKTQLGKVSGAMGGAWKVTTKNDISKSALFSAIQSTFAGAEENDVSLFFIATHGDVDQPYTDPYAGCIITPYRDYRGKYEAITMKELADALAKVPGRIIVLIDSCGSGAAVYDPAVKQNSLSAVSGALEAAGADAEVMTVEDYEAAVAATESFNQQVVDAFAAVDEGVIVEEAPDFSDGPVSGVGEFRRLNKFYVLTASRFKEESWSIPSYNYFTKWFTDGIGSGKLPADTSKDKKITLQEMFKYISKKGDKYKMRPATGGVYYQHVQVYPANSDFVLFKKK